MGEWLEWPMFLMIIMQHGTLILNLPPSRRPLGNYLLVLFVVPSTKFARVSLPLRTTSTRFLPVAGSLPMHKALSWGISGSPLSDVGWGVPGGGSIWTIAPAGQSTAALTLALISTPIGALLRKLVCGSGQKWPVSLGETSSVCIL